MMTNRRLATLAILVAASAFPIASQPVAAQNAKHSNSQDQTKDDQSESWGYEQAKEQAKPKPANPTEAHAPAPKEKPGPSGKAGGKASANPAVSQEHTAADWLSLFKLCAQAEPSAETTTKWQQCIKQRLTAHKQRDLAIRQFWPFVEKEVAKGKEQQENFKGLFRALLRLMQTQESAPCYQDLLSEVLGPQRIAVKDSPPFTEEAIDAYGDMACFLYEQSHPGKTVDAIDNRMVFAGVVRQKFMDAPTLKDKQAMANFALTWSKFKILWFDADNFQKEKLLASLTSKDSPKPPEDATERTLKTILESGPWNEPAAKGESAHAEKLPR